MPSPNPNPNPSPSPNPNPDPYQATFDDAEPGMRREAEQRKHSTVAEALEVGNQMGAWRVLLTHFSNRYPRLADVRAGGAAATRTVPAFDLMEARRPGRVGLPGRPVGGLGGP